MSETARAILIAVAVLVGVLVLLPILWGGAMMGGVMGGFGPGGMMGGWDSGWRFGGLITMVVFLALLGGGLYVLIRAIVGPGGTSSLQGQGRESPLEILKRRYARGEINREEFEQAKKDLST